MAPGSIFHHINLPTLSYFLCFLLCFYFTLHLYHKNIKNIILSYLSYLTLVSGRVGIDNPLSRWLRGFICLCRCEGLVRGLLLDWYLVPITKPYLPHYIICHLPLVFLSPTSPLPFYSPSLFRLPLFARLLFARVLDCLFVTMAQDNTKLCDFTNTNNNDFLSTPIAPLTNTESCEINAALLNLVMKDQFAGLPSEDAPLLI